MLYLIEDRDYLKIGYSKNLSKRLKAYELHNCYAKLIDSKPGNKQDETNLHELCKNYNYNSEWFFNCSEVKQIFKDYQNFELEQIYEYKKYVTEKALTILKNWNTFDKFKIINLYNRFPKSKISEQKLNILSKENYNYCQIFNWRYYEYNQQKLIENFLNNYEILYDYQVLPNIWITRKMQAVFLENINQNVIQQIKNTIKNNIPEATVLSFDE